MTDLTVKQERLAIRGGINDLESAMMQMEQVTIKPVHYFAEGVYAREIFIPKGTVLTGKIHKTEHLNIISKGSIRVVTESGAHEIKAPHTMVSLPGTKRAGYTLEDTVWTTIHATTETDFDKIEHELIAPTFDALENAT